MKTIFSTADIRPSDRYDCWHDVARRYLVDHDSRPDCRLSFEATLGTAALEDLALISFEASPMTVSHLERHIAHAEDELLVCRQLTGTLLLEQNGRRATLDAGDLALLDPRLPYTGRLSGHPATLVLKVPRQRLVARIGRTGSMIACALRSNSGENGLISQFLALLPTHVENLGASAGIVAEQTLDLLGLALAKAAGTSRPQVSSPRFVVLMQLRSAIDKRLTDPTLNPAVVAAAAGVSVRYANAVLADEHTSIARLIQTQRLERCRQALSDPMQVYRTVAEIAYGWGFSDMTHFGRRFKSAFGLLPSEYRRSHCPAD